MTDTAGKSDIRSTIYRIIRIGYVGDVPSRIFDIIIAASILVNLFIIFFETFEVSVRYIPFLNGLEFATIVIFTVEYILRLVTADLAYPEKKTFAGALFAFILSFYGLIDLFSFLPYWLSYVFPAATVPAGVVAFRMLRVVRIFRLFRVNRYYDAFNVITDVIKEKKNQIMSAVFIILMMLISASVIMYNLEHEAQPDQFKNAFSGIWWAVSALLTVGYGDIYPITPMGRFVGILLAFLGVGIVAIPTGIISAGFVQQYTKIKDLAGTSEEIPLGFIVENITEGHGWCDLPLSSVKLPEGMMIYAVIRDNRTVLPTEDSVIIAGDRVLVGSRTAQRDDMLLGEIMIREKSEWEDSKVSDMESGLKVVCLMIKRDGRSYVPESNDIIRTGDVAVVFTRVSGGKM